MASLEDRPGPLQRRRLWLYSLPQIPHSLAVVPVLNFVPAFYADTLALPIAAVGMMLLLTRLTDIVTDPLVGIWSDRTRSRFGRRKPFILGGLPILMAAIWMTFVPPEGAGLGWLFAGLFLLYLGLTIVDIPYVAWGAELASDYDGRSKVAAVRSAFGTVGTLIALAVPVVLTALGVGGTANALFAMAIFYIVAQPLFFLIALRAVPEPEARGGDGASAGWRELAGALFENRALLRLIVCFVFIVAGMLIGATLHLLVITHAIGAPEAFPIMLFGENLLGLAALPVWLWIAKRWGKHRALALVALWLATFTALTFLWDRGDVFGFSAMIVLRGAGLAALVFLGASMVADTVDEDLARTGVERTGLMNALLSMATKLAIAIGAVVGTSLPAIFGFQPSDAVHAPESILGLRLTYAFAGAALMMPAAFVIWRYPLTRERLEQLRAG
jgi:glycoside/pentoside/hexuronide:cation symporter, GPH family